MNTHPDVLWTIVKDHQARLRAEAEHQNQIDRLLRVEPTGRDPYGERLLIAGRHRRRWFGRPINQEEVSHPAGTLAACGPVMGD